MKIFSFDNFITAAKGTFLRFPLTIICVYVATLITIWYADRVFDNEEVAKLTFTTFMMTSTMYLHK